MQEIVKPIGPYQPGDFDYVVLHERLEEIRNLPQWLSESTSQLKDEQLEVPYREGGWNIMQIVHHLADSHMNAYIRCKLAYTENLPIIKPYDQDKWAAMHDTDSTPIIISIDLLTALHHRWHIFFSKLKEEEWNLAVMHPEYNREMNLWFILGLYAWHGKHHVAQINALRSFKGW